MIQWRKGLPATGAMHFGKSGITDFNLVPKPPANIIASLMSMLSNPFQGLAEKYFSSTS
jgi:hypothetical protein